MERVLFSHLLQDSKLGGLLTEYDGRPAIFYQKSPSTEDSGWNNSCFPRVEFVIDRSSDPERKGSGKLWFHIWVSALNLSPSGGNLEREIENHIKDRVDSLAFCCSSWYQSGPWVKRA